LEISSRQSEKRFISFSGLATCFIPMSQIGIKQVGMAKKVAAARHFLFSSRFPKKDSRTNAKFAILESPSKRGF
jgi:hypothetical protein